MLDSAGFGLDCKSECTGEDKLKYTSKLSLPDYENQSQSLDWEKENSSQSFQIVFSYKLLDKFMSALYNL